MSARPSNNSLRDRMAGERGIALAGVLLIGFALSLLVSVIVSRGVRAFGNTQQDAEWEQAVFVAESGLSDGLSRVDADPYFSTGHSLPESYLNSRLESSWVLVQADEVAETDLYDTPEGEYVFIKPSNVGLVYGVGFVPSRAAADRTVRIVRAEIDSVPSEVNFVINHSLIADGDLKISGDIETFGATAGIHTNGNLDMSGNPTLHDACLTAVGSASIGGTLTDPATCDSPGAQEVVELPDIVPRDHWFMSHYDLCPSGVVKAGPSHPTLGNTVGNSPCTGQTLTADASSGYRGWKYGGCCDSKMGAMWDYDGNTGYDGVFYFFRASVVIGPAVGTASDPWVATIIAEAEGSCSAHVGGDVYVSGDIYMHPFTSGSLAFSDNNILILAGRDVEWSGSGTLPEPSIITAVEQIKINGNPDATNRGAYLAQDECDSVEDNIDLTEVSGVPYLVHADQIETPWTGTGGPPVIIIDGWDEL